MKLLNRVVQGGFVIMFSMMLQNCTTVHYQTRFDDLPSRGSSRSDNYDSDWGSGRGESTPRVSQEKQQQASQSNESFYTTVSNTVDKTYGAFRYEDLILRKARRYSIDHYLMMALVEAESRGNTMAISSSNCRGLTQLKISTARDYMPNATMSDLHDPEINIEIASQHMARLRAQVQQFFPDADLMQRVELLAAAWNAGWGNVKRSRGVPNISETHQLVARVSQYYRHLRWGN